MHTERSGGSSGDRGVFDPHGLVGRWFETYHAPLYRYLQRLTGDDQLAADLLQDTFVRAVRSVQQQQVPQHPAAWLHRVATNLAYQALGQRARWRWMRLSERESSAAFEPGILTSDAVRRALQQVSPAEREALLLYEWAGLSTAEIADVTNERSATIRMRLSRARARFSVAYAREVRHES